jgi:5-methylcytosine-specific restriction endonuclease McrA
MVLNQDFQLLNIANWDKALNLMLEGKVTVLETYDQVIRSASHSWAIPAVVSLNYYVNAKKKNKVFNSPTKRNIFIRDDYTCQYCGIKVSLTTGTLDHVQPLSRGGPNIITNIVCACKKCNNNKADMTAKEFEDWQDRRSGDRGYPLKNQPRHLNEDEKLKCILKSYKSKERLTWLKCLKDHGIELW